MSNTARPLQLYLNQNDNTKTSKSLEYMYFKSSSDLPYNDFLFHLNTNS